MQTNDYYYEIGRVTWNYINLHKFLVVIISESKWLCKFYAFDKNNWYHIGVPTNCWQIK